METLELKNYAIHVGEVWEKLPEFLTEKKYSRLFVLVDRNTRQHCLPVFLEKMPGLEIAGVIEIPFGEKFKTLDTCQIVWQHLLESGADRHSLLICLGGGMVGDLGGFCAGTYMRGIDFVQVPTTLLAMTDAAIGGKTGVDFQGIKNAIGLFNDPAAVFIAPVFLATLYPRELRSGLAEIIKHCLIADRKRFESFEEIRDSRLITDWQPHILHSLRIKQRIVEADPREQGPRKALNFGHTVGHALEALSLTSEKPLLHGEAVAIGMVVEAHLSWKNGSFTWREVTRIQHLLARFFRHYDFEKTAYPAIFDLMRRDKKNADGELRFTLLRRIGEAVTDQPMPEKAVTESLNFYLSF